MSFMLLLCVDISDISPYDIILSCQCGYKRTLSIEILIHYNIVYLSKKNKKKYYTYRLK